MTSVVDFGQEPQLALAPDYVLQAIQVRAELAPIAQPTGSTTHQSRPIPLLVAQPVQYINLPGDHKALSDIEPFFEIRTTLLAANRNACGLCVGFEDGTWREDALASHLMEWLPQFCLAYSELQSVSPQRWVAKVREAAKRLYSSNEFLRRGEFGELLLHAVICEIYKSHPAISKIYYKSTANETVKGFDAVHVVEGADGELELWLGEVKFYASKRQAIADIVAELKNHSTQRYLKDEFLLIRSKIDSNWPHKKKLDDLIREKRSLDTVFSRLVFPCLITFEWNDLKSHSAANQKYTSQFAAEVASVRDAFISAKLDSKIRIEIIALPIRSKASLVENLHGRLKAWQAA